MSACKVAAIVERVVDTMVDLHLSSITITFAFKVLQLVHRDSYVMTKKKISELAALAVTLTPRFFPFLLNRAIAIIPVQDYVAIMAVTNVDRYSLPTLFIYTLMLVTLT